jgi:tyrosyl-tRNA synthetase
MKDFLSICRERGFIHQLTDEEGLQKHMQQQVTSAYTGYDCTADSLHVGHLVSIMMLRWLQKCGHKPIVLMGGGTTKVGDPSGKDQARQMLTDDVIAQNMAGIKHVFEQFLTFGEGETDAMMVNNNDWLSGLQYIEFLRDYGRHFSVNRMMGMESVKQRLTRESHLSFLEFNYMILQAYDFVELNKRFGCRLQFGGSDQWGNIVMGIELQRRFSEGTAEELYGLTVPLLTTASGAKMGKTAGGAVWLNAERLSPYDYWQYWRNTEDADVIRFMKLFTELPLEQIAEYEAWLGSAQINDAKIILATEATALLHGRAAAEEAQETARKTFVEGTSGAALPEVSIAAAELESGIPAFSLFLQAGLATSGKEARRLIAGGGAKLNDVKIDNETQMISLSDMQDDQIKLSAGKKKHVLVKAA